MATPYHVIMCEDIPEVLQGPALQSPAHQLVDLVDLHLLLHRTTVLDTATSQCIVQGSHVQHGGRVRGCGSPGVHHHINQTLQDKQTDIVCSSLSTCHTSPLTSPSHHLTFTFTPHITHPPSLHLHTTSPSSGGPHSAEHLSLPCPTCPTHPEEGGGWSSGVQSSAAIAYSAAHRPRSHSPAADQSGSH